MRTFKATIVVDSSTCAIPLPFDPKAVFGKVRAPVRVTINKHTWRSTIAAMGGPACIPFRASNREAAGIVDRWKALSYTHQREHVEAIEEAKKPETRARRIAAAVAMVGG